MNTKIVLLKGKERVAVLLVVIVITAYFASAASNHLSNKEGDSLVDGCPADMIFVPNIDGGFCIDKYEVSAGEDCPYQNPDTQDKTRVNLDILNCQPASEANRIPWRFISKNQAAMACAKAGKRLASNREWYQAALGTPDLDSPRNSEDCQVAENWEEQPGLSGSGEKCISAAGAYDMIGNVWEWVDGNIEDGNFNDVKLPGEGFVVGVDQNGLPTEVNKDVGDVNYYNDYFWIKEDGVRAIARGGYWDNQSDAGQYAVYAVAKPSYAGVGIGFRCVK